MQDYTSFFRLKTPWKCIGERYSNLKDMKQMNISTAVEPSLMFSCCEYLDSAEMESPALTLCCLGVLHH